ncbi:MAG: hypothetical protein GY849_14325, partial [Deltaproteobacteria bacterium]|nr:hypothetical protein [Deltaproteobacteria bacterium]
MAKNKMAFGYNNQGQLMSVFDTFGRQIEIVYYPFEMNEAGTGFSAKAGRIKSVTDFSGREVVFDYSPEGDLTEADIMGRTYKYQYDSDNKDDVTLAHNLEVMTNPEEHTYNIDYLDDNVHKITYDGAVTQFSTTPTGATITDPNENTRTISLNGNYQVMSVTPSAKPGGPVTDFVYDDNSLLLKNVTYPNGTTVYYNYNADTGLLTSVSENYQVFNGTGWLATSAVTSYDYDPACNKLERITYPNGAEKTYAYNKFGQLVSEDFLAPR